MSYEGLGIEFGKCHSHLVKISVNIDHLRKTFDNLTENALKHTPKDDKKITVGSEIFPEIVRIKVTDNGAGISPENLEKILDAFISIPTQYSAKGTGLGLFIVRQTVRAHGGKLTAYSEGVNKGATFIVELPRSDSYSQI